MDVEVTVITDQSDETESVSESEVYSSPVKKGFIPTKR